MNKVISMRDCEDIRVCDTPEFDDIALAILGEFEKKDEHERRRSFAQSRRGGGVFLVTSETRPEYMNKILEVVPGIGGDDFMTCLYEPNKAFNTPGETLKLRERLIESIECLHGVAPGAVMIPDGARGRRLHLQELSTMQLIDHARKTMTNLMVGVGA